jgi:hypothetical protein
MATPARYGRTPALPLALIAQAVPKLTRHDLEALTERLIDRLDELDPDPDFEDDDPAGQCDEDGINTRGPASFAMHGQSFGRLGYPISEPIG